MRRILVTGAAGFIGSNFVQFWAEHHPADKIIGLDALTYAGNLASLEPVAKQIYTVTVCEQLGTLELQQSSKPIMEFLSRRKQSAFAQWPSFKEQN